MRKHYVRFLSPGTFFSEESSREIDSWDPRKAAEIARSIKERYGAMPYAFYFITCLSRDPVPDGEGGFLKVEAREVSRSGRFFLTGQVETYDQIEARVRLQGTDERILLSNMRCNNYPLVVVNTNSYKTTQPFEDKDVIVNWSGDITDRGDAPARVEYRARMTAMFKVLG